MAGVVSLMIPMRENSLVTLVSVPDPQVLYGHVWRILLKDDRLPSCKFSDWQQFSFYMTAFLTLLIACSCSSVNLHGPSLAFLYSMVSSIASLDSRVWAAIFIVMLLTCVTGHAHA